MIIHTHSSTVVVVCHMASDGFLWFITLFVCTEFACTPIIWSRFCLASDGSWLFFFVILCIECTLFFLCPIVALNWGVAVAHIMASCLPRLYPYQCQMSWYPSCCFVLFSYPWWAHSLFDRFVVIIQVWLVIQVVKGCLVWGSRTSLLTSYSESVISWEGFPKMRLSVPTLLYVLVL